MLHPLRSSGYLSLVFRMNSTVSPVSMKWLAQENKLCKSITAKKWRNLNRVLYREDILFISSTLSGAELMKRFICGNCLSLTPWLCFCFHWVVAGAHSNEILLRTNSANPGPIHTELYVSGPHCKCEASTIFVGSGTHFHPHFNTNDTH